MLFTKLMARVAGARLVGDADGVDIEGLCADSKTVTQGVLFFCINGEHKDGTRFAGEAVKRGAVAIVAEKEVEVNVPQIIVEDAREAMSLIACAYYGDPSERLKLIAITGTNGKTTTAHMLASILRTSGKKVGVIGTLGANFDGKTEKLDLTTPDPICLQKTLCKMSALGAEYVVFEASAHALWFRKLAGVRLCACVFTNLTQDHLDFFDSMQTYKEAKSRLFADNVCPIAIINGDDTVGREFGGMRTGETLYYGLKTPTDAFAVITEETLYKTTCVFNIQDKLCRASLSLTGRHNVYNALGASLCALRLGASTEAVSLGLSAMKSVKGRLERVISISGAEIFVDFAHTPDGLEKSLDALQEHCKGKLVCVFGCGGNRDKSKRAIMGETVAKRCDFAVLTSDNPRYEDPLDIITEIERGYRRFSQQYVVVPERERAIRYAIDFLSEKDILIVAGKGGEETQEIMGIKYPFNDNAIIKKICKEKEVQTRPF